MYQLVVEGQLGKFTLPCVVKAPDGSHRFLYSHNGEWQEEDLQRLFEWTMKVRARQETLKVPILLLTEPDPAPAKAKEIVSNQASSLIVMLATPYLNGDDPQQTAWLMQHALKHLFDREFGYSRAGLETLDDLASQGVAPVADDGFLRPYLVALLGAFVGESVIQVHGGKWGPAPQGHPEWMKVVEIGGFRVNPMGRASKFLRDPEGERLAHFFDMSAPERLKALGRQIRKS